MHRFFHRPRLWGSFIMVDRLVTGVELLATALVGLLLLIPKIKNSRAFKMFNLIYRLGFIIMFAN